MLFEIGKLYKLRDEITVTPAVYNRMSISPGQYITNFHSKFLCISLLKTIEIGAYRDSNFSEPVSFTNVNLLNLFNLKIYETITYDDRFIEVK